METDTKSSPAIHWIPLVTSVFVKHPYSIATVGFCVGYYLHATIGFARFLQLIPYDIAVAAISGLALQPVVDQFYAEIKEQYRGAFPFRSFQIPDRSIFYQTIISDIGTRRKCAGYVYAVAQTFLAFASGVFFSLILGRGELPAFWTVL